MLKLEAALKAKGLSNRKAGAETLARWKTRIRLSEYPKATSIATELGELKKGNSTWWLKQPDALASLAEILGCTPAELIPGAQPTSVIAFREFPELSELLPGQEPCAVRSDVGWLGGYADSLLQKGTHAWVIAGAGSGKSLSIQVLKERHGARLAAVAARRLFDAVREAKENLPLLIEVESLDEATDKGALSELTKRSTAVCVLAPFARPLLKGANSSWFDVRWAMAEDWREPFLLWAHARLPKPDELDTDAVLDWLEAVDPRGDLFRTPGHLLPVLARAYRAGLPKGASALRDLGREFVAQLLGAHRSSWMRREGGGAIERLVVARLQQLNVPLAALTSDRWGELLAGTSANETPTAPQTTKSAKGKKPSSDDGLQPLHPRLVVAALADTPLLETSENGDLDVAPWIRVGIEREVIANSVKASRNEWGEWAVNDSRRDAVDDALDTLSPVDLVIAVQNALAADPTLLSTVASLEALFSAIGRRMIDAEWIPPTTAVPVLHELGKRQLALLAALPNVGTIMPLLPLTRHRPGRANLNQVQWLAEAWTFSFAVKRPDDLAQDPSWTLPGWSQNLMLSDAPKTLPWPVAASADDNAVYGRLLTAARKAVRACCDQHVPDGVEALVLPWVIIDGHQRGWSLSKKDGALLVTSKIGGVIGRLLQREPKDVQRAAVQLAWSAALRERDGYPLDALGRLKIDAPLLSQVVLEELPPDVFAAAFTREVLKRTVFDDRLESLPPRLLRAMLPPVADFLRNGGRPIPEIATAVSALGQADIDLLVELAGDRYSVGVTATSRAWEVDPERALHEAKTAMRSHRDAEAYAWFYSAPTTRYGELLAAMQQAPLASISWANRWLAEALPLAGAEAPLVFSLMRLSAAT